MRIRLVWFLYLYKSTNQTFMEHFYHVLVFLVGVPSCICNRLCKMQGWFNRVLGRTIAAFLGPLTHLANENLFYRYDFKRCLSEMVKLVSLPYSRRRSTRYSNRLLVIFDHLF